MDLHIVSGFLGSGKTTAIMAACKLLMAQGKRVGVVTNDQGRYLVDTAFFRLGKVPAVEVSGGCFCCNYDDLSERLERLQAMARPDVIFAESVGSCADIVATVVEPLLALRGTVDGHTTLTAFADSRLLRRRLLGLPMPYSDEVVYIFDMQLAEAERIAVNKVDLLAADQLDELRAVASSAYGDRPLLWQNSLDEISVAEWVSALVEGAASRGPMDIDYDLYGRGETRLAWLDQTLMIETEQGELQAAATWLLDEIVTGLERAGASIAHLKVMLSGAEQEAKVSITGAGGDQWQGDLPLFAGSALAVMLNARVEASPEQLEMVVRDVVARAHKEQGARVTLEAGEAFRPDAPQRPPRADAPTIP